MNKLKYIFAFAALLMLSVSCEDSLNINEDPLLATSADPATVIPFVQVQYSSRKVTELGTRITDVSQILSSNFNSPRQGNTSIFLIGNTWFMMYSQVLGNLQLLINDAIEAGDSQLNVLGISQVMRAMTYYELSSLWEDVPFTEAIDGANFPTPNFDTQETVLKGCIDILDDAIATLESVPATGIVDLSVGDQWYGGNTDNWIRYANTLKLRILFMIRNADAGYADSRIAAVLNSASVIETNAQAAMLRYPGGAGAENGMFTIITAFFGPSNEAVGGVHAPGGPLYDLIATNGDPRYDVWVVDAAGDHAGIGIFPAFSNPALAQYTDDVIRGNLPDIYALPAEVHYYRAEAILKGIAGVTGDAQTEFDAGVRLDLEFWGGDIPGATVAISDADITAFIGSLPPVTLQQVHEQQYLNSFPRPVVAWNTVRRTEVPVMEQVPGSNITTILKRFNYPPDEIGSNPNTPANVPTDTKMWFEPN